MNCWSVTLRTYEGIGLHMVLVCNNQLSTLLLSDSTTNVRVKPFLLEISTSLNALWFMLGNLAVGGGSGVSGRVEGNNLYGSRGRKKKINCWLADRKGKEWKWKKSRVSCLVKSYLEGKRVSFMIATFFEVHTKSKTLFFSLAERVALKCYSSLCSATLVCVNPVHTRFC